MMKPPPNRPADALTHKKLVVLAAFLAGGDAGYTDTEDIAVAAAKLAPGRFSWRKYPEQIDIDAVRRRLVDVARPEFGGYFTMHGENVDRLRGRPGRGMFGTGKCAAFGIANKLRITTVRNGRRSRVELDRAAVASPDAKTRIPISVLEENVSNRWKSLASHPS